MPKISELASMTAPAAGDLIPIVDTAGVITKKVTRANLLVGAALPNNTVTTASITDNSVTASKLATNAITLGYAQITSSFSTSSASSVFATGLTVTVTIPSGGRNIRVSFWARDINVST